jgi:hypothetical protein
MLRRVMREMWGEEPVHPRVWSDRAEREIIDERNRWFVVR